MAKYLKFVQRVSKDRCGRPSLPTAEGQEGIKEANPSFQMLKRLGVIPSIALAHFVVCIGVISFTRTMGTGAADNIQAAYGIFKIMAGLTRILYFPIISCALYSRSWFPGNWIYILIFVNSLVWGGGVYLVFVLFRKVCRRS